MPAQFLLRQEIRNFEAISYYKMRLILVDVCALWVLLFDRCFSLVVKYPVIISMHQFSSLSLIIRNSRKSQQKW